MKITFLTSLYQNFMCVYVIIAANTFHIISTKLHRPFLEIFLQFTAKY